MAPTMSPSCCVVNPRLSSIELRRGRSAVRPPVPVGPKVRSKQAGDGGGWHWLPCNC